MIIRKISLHPFAKFINSNFEFQSGLNIVSGINEAGKSTLMKALLMVLFDSTKQTPAAGERLVKDLLPLSGGDVIAVDLEFESNNEKYILKKQWGKTSFSSLNKQNEAAITDPIEVQNKIDEILGQNRMVWESVMFATQSELSKTYENLNKKAEVTTTLDSILQNAILNNAGIPPEEVQQKIEEQLKPLTLYWDIQKNQPQFGDKQKGSFDNRYANPGEILKLHYKIYDNDIKLKNRLAQDTALDKIVTEIESASTKYNNEVKSFIDKYKNHIEDYKKRLRLQIENSTLEKEVAVLKVDFEKWNKADSQTALLKDNYDKSKKAKEKIAKEFSIAQQKQASAVKIEKLKQIDDLKQQIENVSTEQNQSVKIEETDYNKIKQLNDNLDKGLAKFDGLKNAQSFNVEITSINNITVDIKKGKGTKEPVELNTAEPLAFNVEGGFELKSHELSIKVLSSDDKILECEKGIKFLEAKIKEILVKYEIDKAENLIQIFDNWKLNQNNIDTIQNQIRKVLGNEDYDSLKNQVEELNALEESRSIQTLTPLVQEATNEEFENKSKYEQNIDLIQEFVKKYESLEKLKDLCEKGNRDLASMDLQIKNLAPLPESGIDLQELIVTYDKKLTLEKENIESINELEKAKIQIESDIDDVAADDYIDIIERLKEEKEQKIKEAKALINVHQKLDEIISRAPVDPYEGYFNKMHTYLSVLSNQKYTALNIENSVPSAIKQNNQYDIPISVLSQGTKGILGLALRLSMADYFLDDKKGFLILDDPMTDLDEIRQQSTVNCLAQYADSKQTIIFTCHQTHANQFGGNKIDLNNN